MAKTMAKRHPVKPDCNDGCTGLFWGDMLVLRLCTIGLVVTACASTHSSSESARAAAERERAASISLDHVTLAPGTSHVSVQVDGGSRELLLRVPKGDMGNPRPLVVFLHGASGANSLDRLAECLLEPGLAPVQPVILAPVSASPRWWVGSDARFVLGLVDAAVQKWPLQANRVVVVGYSDGGIGAWSFIRLYPEVFSAAIPIASSPSIMGASSRPVHAIHGQRDELFAIGAVQQEVDLLQREGSDVTLTVNAQGTHFDACGYAAELRSAAKWLVESAWTRRAKKKRPREPTAPPMMHGFSGP